LNTASRTRDGGGFSAGKKVATGNGQNGFRLFPPGIRMVREFIKKFEHGVIFSLVAMMTVVILLSTIELAYIIVKDIFSPPLFWLEIDELLDIFGFFLLILIGVELLESIKAYLADKVVHFEVVLEVALIAITRKVIILDLKEYSALTVIGVAALILSIAIAYYLLKRKSGVSVSR
jgi:uncharacterized membrane protein (DUF373 family)